MGDSACQAFPSAQLRVQSGTIDARIFENESIGLARDIWWNLRVVFDPVSYMGNDVETSFSVRRMKLGLRSWKDLVGAAVGPSEGTECSFYLYDHRPIDEFSVRFNERRGDEFAATLEFVVDLGDRYDLADPPLSRIVLESTVTFVGVEIYAGIVSGKTAEASRRIASRFISLDDLHPPEVDPAAGCFFAPRIC